MTSPRPNGKIPHVCSHCGNDFMAHASTERRYCNRKCYWASKKVIEKRICLVCEKTFEVWPSEKNRFCSQTCSGIAQRKREERVCKRCGKAFSVYHHRPDIYCSQSCAAQANNAARKTIRTIRICANCGKKFEQKRRDYAGKFCSRVCSDATNKNPPAQEWIQKECAYCKKPFPCPPWRPEIAHCSNKCSKIHRGQTVRGVNHPLWKDKVEMTCEVCGKVRMVKPSLVSRFRACSRRCATVLGILAQQGHQSSIERKMQISLRDCGLYPIPQHPIGPYVVDFAMPECHLVIECDGDYWHGPPEQQAKDKRRDAYLQRHGWRVLRFWEHRIHDDIDGCIQDIINSLNNIA